MHAARWPVQVRPSRAVAAGQARQARVQIAHRRQWAIGRATDDEQNLPEKIKHATHKRTVSPSRSSISKAGLGLMRLIRGSDAMTSLRTALRSDIR
jgi:hypothetical protein